SRSRPSIQFGKERIMQRLGLQLRRLALRAVLPILVVQIAKDDGPGRAGALAGGYDVALAECPVFKLGLDLAGADALHAVSAFLHHAATADRDLRIVQ